MTSAPGSPWTPDDARIVDDEVEHIAGRTPTRDLQLPGCLVAFGGMFVLTVTPALGSWIELPEGAPPALLALAVAALFAGAGMAILGGSARSRAARRDCEAALAPIRDYVDGGDDRDAAIRAAVRLLSSAVVDPGPGADRTFPPERMAERLGPVGLELVLQVERHRLANDRGIGPVFTWLSDPSRD